MKSWLFMIALVGVMFFWASSMELAEDLPAVRTESTIKDRDAIDMKQHLEILTNELKEHTCVLPRTVQLTNNTINTRNLRNQERVYQLICIKGTDRLCKISGITADFQIINFQTLLCRKGYYIYALRQLLI